MGTPNGQDNFRQAVDDAGVDLLDVMASERRSWTSARVAEWTTPARVLAALREELREEADRVGDLRFGQDYLDAVGPLGPPDPLCWANRRLALREGGWAVTGIRFRGQDLGRPFVDVVATTAPPTPDGLAALADAVRLEYAGFDPRCLRVTAPAESRLLEELVDDDRFSALSRVDLHVMAGPVEQLRSSPLAVDDVRLAAVDPDRAAQDAALIYEDLLTTHPQSVEWAEPEDAESLAQAAEQHLLFRVLVAGRPAGVVAAVRARGHGMDGFSVQELCLSRDFRGRGLARAVVQGLLAALPARAGDALWGTIHPDNAPSLRNALRVGRQVVASQLWVVPEGLPGMPGATEH